MKPLSPEIKQQIQMEINRLVPEKEAGAWLKTLDFLASEDGAIEIPLPNVYYREWYEKHYRESIIKALTKVLGNKFNVVFKTVGDYQGTLFQPAQEMASKTAELSEKPGKRTAEQSKTGNGELNPKYTFENFVVGSCNRLAHAWMLAVVESPGRAYNPLFIHGAVGLGKTHLLQAGCHYLLQKNKGVNIYFLSCESFVNDYIGAVKSGKYEEFRSKYRSVDVLIVDDIHFLGIGEKQASQEEFFHTFNALHNAQKQIILSSDSPPQDIPSLAERLVSRFKWGRVARLDPPTFETRMAILKQVSEWLNKPISDEVCNFIATNIDTNIRDLEGALKNVLGYAEVVNQPITLSLAQEALKDLISATYHPITISQIQEVVSKYFNIPLTDLRSKKRTKSITIPRQIGIYLARTLTPFSLEEIGASFGKKDHTTVMYAIEKIKQRIGKDASFKATLELLNNNLKHFSPR